MVFSGYVAGNQSITAFYKSSCQFGFCAFFPGLLELKFFIGSYLYTANSF